MDLKNIKLVIWDLDETLWSGVISENTEKMPEENITLIRNMIDCGVMCSICSKNDETIVKDFLVEKGIWELFVFPSINWSSKGDRVVQIVNEMNLRPVNVLFIDDNHTNRAEVSFSSKDLNVADIDVIPELIEYFAQLPKKDCDHSRLKQYKVLEKKKEFRVVSGSNEEFLNKSCIQVEMLHDCENHIDRLEDLIMRSNQLNFTKIRSNREELVQLLNNPNIEKGYVKVKDLFGDYGIVGFYALRNNLLIHFVFSCRTLGMGVEQYVYRELGKPDIKIVGDVSSDLNSPDPYWININSGNADKKSLRSGKIVFKGPCDMSQLFAYINCGSEALTEFVYVNSKGVSIEQGNHSTIIVEGVTLSKDEKQHVIESVPFNDVNMFNTSIFQDDVDYIVFSLFTDPNLGVYQEKETGFKVAFGEYVYDLTDSNLWNDIIEEKVNIANCKFTLPELERIRSNFEYKGRLSPEEIKANVSFIFNHMNPKAKLILILGSETPYLGNTNKAYEDRHEFNKVLNDLIRNWKADKSRVILLDVNNYIDGQDAFTNNINHFSRLIFYKMSLDLIQILREDGLNNIKQNGKVGHFMAELRRKTKKLLSNPRALIMKRIKGIYRKFLG